MIKSVISKLTSCSKMRNTVRASRVLTKVLRAANVFRKCSYVPLLSDQGITFPWRAVTSIWPELEKCSCSCSCFRSSTLRGVQKNLLRNLVLYLIEPIDEIAIQTLQTYKEKKFVDISKEDLEPGTEKGREEIRERKGGNEDGGGGDGGERRERERE